MLTPEQTAFYAEQGYLHIPQVFSAAEIDALDCDLERLVAEWASTTPGWSGPWRRVYMDEETEKASRLTAMHDLYFYSSAWCRAVTHPRLVQAITQLLGPDVELHHSTMHIKPPETGHPFPMHQDWAFYQHVDGRYMDVLVHLDDTCHENGEISASSPARTGRGRWSTSRRPRRVPARRTCPRTATAWPTPCPCLPGAATWCASASIPSTARTSTRRTGRDAWCASGTGIPTTGRRPGRVVAGPG